MLLLAGFAACAPLEQAVNPYHEDFKCRASDETGACLDTPSAYSHARYGPVPVESAQGGDEGKRHDQRYQLIAGLLEEPEKPLLQPPKILRVLLLPYEGQEQELFMTRYVYLKIEDSDWILSEINERRE